jgi:hypothetical protein
MIHYLIQHAKLDKIFEPKGGNLLRH